MTAASFSKAQAFVWRDSFDSPTQGYHDTPGDSGGGTFGGVTEATWSEAVRRGFVTGTLRDAKQMALSTVLYSLFWSPVCNALPAGTDLAFFNGTMQSGEYPRLFQRCLGFAEGDVDGEMGTASVGRAVQAHPATLIRAQFGVHHAYLEGLPGWAEFGGGWHTRLTAAVVAAMALLG